MEENKINLEEETPVKRGRGRLKWEWKSQPIVVHERVIERTGKPGSWKYVWDDKLAMKKKLTEKQKAFVDEYLKSHNASSAYRASKGTLSNPEEWLDWDRGNARVVKNNPKVMAYLQEKIFSDAAECLDIQMEMIRDDKTPAAVRNAAIVDRLNRAGVWKQKEESWDFTGVWQVTITIKHKRPEIIEMVNEDKDLNEEDIIDAETV